MGGGLNENPRCSSLVSLLFLPGFSVGISVLVAELTQTMCDTYGGDRSLTTGVCIECGHPLILIAKCKAIGAV